MASGLGNFLTFVEEHNAFSIKHSLSFLPCFNITSSQWGKSNCVFISTAQGSGPAGCSPRCNCMSKDTADKEYILRVKYSVWKLLKVDRQMLL